MSWHKGFISNKPPHPTLQALAVCAALASIIKSTCESFERGKEGIERERGGGEKNTGLRTMRERERVPDRDRQRLVLERHWCMSVSH